ncbi:MAG: TIR domain-containing protein [Opitutus sp.]|nr:TIR domain-containing protein [Opitutus sp.]
MSVELSPASRAVFLSYASQDAEAARRICEALRASGIEVWFDADGGLEHGDEWDMKIRRQIKECVFFIPVISANTQARLEGYFRIEWELAAQRAMGIAAGVPFILPIAIDDTRDAEALVPDRFRSVQWMRLPSGVVPPEAQARLLKLWSHRTGFLAHESSRSLSAGYQPPVLPPLAPARSRRGLYAALAAAVVALAGAGWWWTQRVPAPAATPMAAPTANLESSASAIARPTASDKSLVVLPLENLSPDPAHARFADGLHTEITSTLQSISGLKVISARSAQHYKDSKLPLAKIAQELGVANVIVGSVLREHDTVRIHLELRRASDEALLWSSPKHDRTLTGVLALQSEIADEVARALKARDAKGMVATARHTTKSAQAFELYLKMNDLFWSKFNDRDTMLESIRLARQAFELDPTYLSAAQMLGITHGMLYLGHAKDAAERATFKAEALKWGETASRLAPGGAGDGALVQYYAQVEHVPPRAIALAENGLRAAPNDSAMWNFYASALGSMGRHADSAEAQRRAIEIDPRLPVLWGNLTIKLSYLRRGKEWLATVAHFEAMSPSEVRQMRSAFLFSRFRLFGELPTDFTGMNPLSHADWLLRARKGDAALALLEQELSAGNKPPGTLLALQLRRSDALRLKGDTAGATAAAKTAVPLAEEIGRARTANEYATAMRLADALVRAGRADEAVAAAQRAVESVSEKTSPSSRIQGEVQLAGVLAHAGRTRECLELLAKLLRLPSGLTVPMLRVDPIWDRVRGDSGFKALLADPKNSAPL